MPGVAVLLSFALAAALGTAAQATAVDDLPASIHHFERWLEQGRATVARPAAVPAASASLIELDVDAEAAAAAHAAEGVALARRRLADLHALAASRPQLALRAMKRLEAYRALREASGVSGLPAFLEEGVDVEERIDANAQFDVLAYASRGLRDSKITRAVVLTRADGTTRRCAVAKHGTYVDSLPSRNSINVHGFATEAAAVAGGPSTCRFVMEEVRLGRAPHVGRNNENRVQECDGVCVAQSMHRADSRHVRLCLRGSDRCVGWCERELG